RSRSRASCDRGRPRPTTSSARSSRRAVSMSEAPGTNRIDVFLDDGAEPIASYSPPLRFELDTTRLPDGPHTLRVEAYDSFGTKGVKVVRFTVRNGPGIVVSGLRQDDVLEGTVPVLVNSYGGAVESKWEPSRAE